MISDRISFYSDHKDDPIDKFEENKGKFPCVNILDNVVLKKSKKNEYLYQDFFSDKVINGFCDNFPIVYNKEFIENDQVIFSMEKFDGVFNSLLIKEEEEVLSFFLQIIMGLHIINSYDKFHGDLNPGNILFKKIENKKDKEYLKYKINGETYYVKHCNRLWVLADFEYMGDKGIELSKHNNAYDDNFFKKIFGKENYKNMKPIKGTWLYDMYVLAQFTGAINLSKTIYNMIQEDCCITPIEAIPMIIKKDITKIFKKSI
jgi:serine/threonine protein kinase